MGRRRPFKTCPCCKAVWPTRADFLADDALVLDGYGADFESLDQGLFYFTHHNPACNSTLALEVIDFMDLYQGIRYSESCKGQPICPRYCFAKDRLDRCDAACENAFVRELLQLIADRSHREASKKESPDPSPAPG